MGGSASVARHRFSIWKMTNRRNKMNRLHDHSISGTIRPAIMLVVAFITMGTFVLLFKVIPSAVPEPSTETVIGEAPPPDVSSRPSRATKASPHARKTMQAAKAIARLAQLGSTNTLSAEQIEEINTLLNRIISLGAPAAAAIHD